jgi:hypothetical protein
MSPTRPCWVIELDFVAGAFERRAPFRAEHLARMRELMGAGELLLAGAYDDMRQALLVFDVESENEAMALVEADVYWREGIWTAHRARLYHRVMPE